MDQRVRKSTRKLANLPQKDAYLHLEVTGTRGSQTPGTHAGCQGEGDLRGKTCCIVGRYTGAGNSNWRNTRFIQTWHETEAKGWQGDMSG